MTFQEIINQMQFAHIALLSEIQWRKEEFASCNNEPIMQDLLEFGLVSKGGKPLNNNEFRNEILSMVDRSQDDLFVPKITLFGLKFMEEIYSLYISKKISFPDNIISIRR